MHATTSSQQTRAGECPAADAGSLLKQSGGRSMPLKEGGIDRHRPAVGDWSIIDQIIDRLTVLIGRQRRLLDRVSEILQIQLLLLLFGSDRGPSMLVEAFAFFCPGRPFPNSAKSVTAAETSFFDGLNNSPSLVFEDLKFAFHRLPVGRGGAIFDQAVAASTAAIASSRIARCLLLPVEFELSRDVLTIDGPPPINQFEEFKPDRSLLGPGKMGRF